MVILVDTNVILDYIITREPYFDDAYKVFEMCVKEKVKAVTPEQFLQIV